jgi:predicted TIM-barrel fold metal-dependent hydrolase
VMRKEVSHLQRKPSEYIRDHFYFHTQPLEETEFAEDLKELWDQFLDFGLGEHLMFATDYPHWDFDSPYSLPAFLGDDLRRSILAETASRVYHIPLLENSGISLPA